MFFLSALTCGLFTSVFTHPLEVIRTKQSTDLSVQRRYKGLMASRSEIVMTETGKTLYRGWVLGNVTNLPLTISLMGFMEIAKRGDQASVSADTLFLTHLAGGLVIYPLDTLKRRMISADVSVWTTTCTSSVKMLQYIINKEGVASLYSGLSPFLVRQLLAFQVYKALLLLRPTLLARQ